MFELVPLRTINILIMVHIHKTDYSHTRHPRWREYFQRIKKYLWPFSGIQQEYFDRFPSPLRVLDWSSRGFDFYVEIVPAEILGQVYFEYSAPQDAIVRGSEHKIDAFGNDLILSLHHELDTDSLHIGLAKDEEPKPPKKD